MFSSKRYLEIEDQSNHWKQRFPLKRFSKTEINLWLHKCNFFRICLDNKVFINLKILDSNS